MEFFTKIIKSTSEEKIQASITPRSVSDFAESMLFIEGDNNVFKGVTLWGEFTISYNKIKGGVRFALLDCPNALAWTITCGYPPEKDKIILHCTINRTKKPIEFIEEIQELLEEWKSGIESEL